MWAIVQFRSNQTLSVCFILYIIDINELRMNFVILGIIYLCVRNGSSAPH